MSRAWMPLYVADYLADTGHLSTAEHGAYLLLIMHYWQNEGLPVDDTKLARICRMSARAWAGSRETLAEFFGPGWSHARIDRELSSAKAAYERRAKAGQKGGNAGANRKPGRSNATSNAAAPLKQSQSPIQPSRRGKDTLDGEEGASPAYTPTREARADFGDDAFERRVLS